MDSYEKLANAIVLQAVKDYRTALKRVAKDRTVISISHRTSAELGRTISI